MLLLKQSKQLVIVCLIVSDAAYWPSNTPLAQSFLDLSFRELSSSMELAYLVVHGNWILSKQRSISDA
jgi:hypothetical protein